MPIHENIHNLQLRATQGPIVPDSTLYRALWHVARAIAKRLTTCHAEGEQGGLLDSHTEDSSKRNLDE